MVVLHCCQIKLIKTSNQRPPKKQKKIIIRLSDKKSNVLVVENQSEIEVKKFQNSHYVKLNFLQVLSFSLKKEIAQVSF